MQGLILAAGMGKRLKELTKHNTKCMVQVNGVTLIERMLHQLENLHLSRIVIVVGYEGKKLIDFIDTLGIYTPICYVNNPIYDKTNNIYSLSLAKEYLLREDTLLLESDLIFEDSVLQALVEDDGETLALVDKYESWMDGTCVKMGKDGSIEAFIPGKKFVFEDIPQYYKTVNIYKFSRHFSETFYVPFLDAYSKALGNNEYYEQVLRVITMLDDSEIKAKKLDGQLWYEIDDIQDLDMAESMFIPDPDKKMTNMQARHGGYWRYPKLLDFSCPGNPYFPPQKMMDEIKANFERLIKQQPSAMGVKCLLAAKNYGVHLKHIFAGGGTSEIIECLMKNITGKVGFVEPLSEKYAKYCRDDKNRVAFTPKNRDFSYTVEDLMDFFENTDIRTLVLINPANLSGNYINRQDVLKLVKWCEEKQIRIILDESSVDFVEGENGTLIEEEIFSSFRNLIIIKSVSESHGVPGLRLGILVTSDESIILEMKKETISESINSFGEFYMQIEEKYQKDYELALVKLEESKKALVDALADISQLRMIPSQANYIMIEVTGEMTSKELTQILLLDHNILVKDLSDQIDPERGQYICITVRSMEDNAKLADAMKRILKFI